MSETTHLDTSSETKAMTPELYQLLRGVDIFSSLKEENLKCLTGVEEVHLAENEYIVHQGEMLRSFWILLAGEIRVFQTIANGHDATLAIVPEGEAFGEVPLLSNSPSPGNLVATRPSHMIRFSEDGFWNLMTSCPEIRKIILGNMALRLQKLQNVTFQQEKMASLGTLAAGLMHELNNPGAAATRAASQLRDNLMRMHALSAKFSKAEMSHEQKECLFELQEHVLNVKRPVMMNSLEQSDAEDALVEWMEGAKIENAWKLAPTLVSIGIKGNELECARHEFPESIFSDALNWLEALVSSMQLVGTIEESIGRVSNLVKAVKSYAYEGKSQKQTLDVNESIHATMVMLGHKLREKEVMLEKDLAGNLPLLQTECSGLNQIWTNVLDNAIDAVPQHGHIKVRTWTETTPAAKGDPHTDICISIEDNGSGIPLESQPHIFDPFYTTKPVGVGTGLGLGIVHRIVDQFGGTIHFTSDSNGTEFVVRLPQRMSDAAPVTAKY